MNEIRNPEETVISRALLVGVNIKEDADFETSMKELKSLAEACEMEVVAKIEQNLSIVNPSSYIGSGKVSEVRETVELMEIDYVIFDHTLSPSQLKNLQKEIDVPILDRTNLILEIFSRRAKTREARMQVESASLQYMLPRLVGMRASLGRQAGASGSLSNKGTGEKQIELDRRKIEKRISELRRELEALEKDRETQRKKRNQSLLPKVALTGYTNAGKSTLLNKLVEVYLGMEEKKVVEKDMLFATLDTTVRKITPGDNKDFLLSDTVGFISRLPHSLVKAFRSTLDEVRYADLLLQVVDFSDEHYKEQIQVTDETLKELGAEKIPCIYIMNKADKVMEEGELPRVVENKIFMSAKKGTGLEMLLQMINEIVFASQKDADYLIPYDKGEIVSYLNDNAAVTGREYLPEGVRLSVTLRSSDYTKYQSYLI